MKGLVGSYVPTRSVSAAQVELPEQNVATLISRLCAVLGADLIQGGHRSKCSFSTSRP